MQSIGDSIYSMLDGGKAVEEKQKAGKEDRVSVWEDLVILTMAKEGLASLVAFEQRPDGRQASIWRIDHFRQINSKFKGSFGRSMAGTL